MNSELKQIIDFILLFNQIYFEETLNRDGQLKFSVQHINEESFIEDLFQDLAPEETDDFMSMYFNYFNVNRDNYYHGLHFKSLYDVLLIPCSLIAKPVIGIKHWMVFPLSKRVRLKTKHLLHGIQKQRINSLLIENVS